MQHRTVIIDCFEMCALCILMDILLHFILNIAAIASIFKEKAEKAQPLKISLVSHSSQCGYFFNFFSLSQRSVSDCSRHDALAMTLLIHWTLTSADYPFIKLILKSL